MSSNKDSFSKFILISTGFHIAVFIALTVKVLFFPSEPPNIEQAVRIDVVALPEKQVEAPKIVEPMKPEVVKKDPPKPMPMPMPVVKKKPPKPMPKPMPMPVVKKKPPKPMPKPKEVQEDQNSALARLKALQKLKEKEKQEETPAQNLELKGNALSKGNSLTGLAKLKHDGYIDLLIPHIRAQWILPEWLASANLRAVVLLKINRSGGMQNHTFLLRSGNENFDDYVSGTLEKSDPFPPPPSNLIDFYETKGIPVGFPE